MLGQVQQSLNMQMGTSKQREQLLCRNDVIVLKLQHLFPVHSVFV